MGEPEVILANAAVEDFDVTVFYAVGLDEDALARRIARFLRTRERTRRR